MLLDKVAGQMRLFGCCLIVLIFLAACGGKEEKKAEHKEETKQEEGDSKKDQAKKSAAKDASKHGEESKGDEFNVKSPAIVAHLRIELNRETNEDNIASVTPTEESPKVVSNEKPEASRALAKASPSSDMGYKTDKEYLALRRFELPAPIVGKRAEPINEDQEDKIKASEKILILGGKGSDIQGFRAKSKDTVSDMSTHHLEAPMPEAPPKPERPHLDLKESDVRSKRSLIFNQQGTGFFKVEDPGVKESVAKVEAPKKATPVLERVPETRLLFSQGKDDQMILKPKEGEIDLLLGNEDFNRRAYDSDRKANK